MTPPDFESWGRLPRARHTIHPVDWSCEPLPPVPASTVLPRGLGRSYGDSCLNDGGALLPTPAMKRILAFDAGTGRLRAEAGISLDEILQVAVPRGWFLPTTPGTKFVTLGGAIANDLHGKNHHRAGTFGCHVTRFELLRSDRRRLNCSPEENREWFAATIGGLGLTGLITWAELQLRRVENAMIDVETIKFGHLEEFFAIASESDAEFEHTVAWVDCAARGRSLGRGHFMRGNHAPAGAGSSSVHRPPRVNLPIDLPAATLSPWVVRAFNFSYYHRLPRRVTTSRVHYDPFFYPLDAIGHWNRLYGRRGFFQYQFVLPSSADRAVLREIFGRIAAAGQASFLAVLKTFGSRPSPGLLSFPMPGVTLALDFPNRGPRTRRLFAELDSIVLGVGGRFYPAKDACMSAKAFRQGYPAWQSFAGFIDPAFSSSFWRRVTASPSAA